MCAAWAPRNAEFGMEVPTFVSAHPSKNVLANKNARREGGAEKMESVAARHVTSVVVGGSYQAREPLGFFMRLGRPLSLRIGETLC